MLVQQLAGGTVKWGQLPVYLLAELLAGAAAALVYVAISRTAADKLDPATAATGPDLADGSAPRHRIDAPAPAR
jgi:glycerol uptake facilitator protein